MTTYTSYTSYTLGFAFDPSLERVLLIFKDKPELQAGLLNGIEGLVKSGQGIVHCMVREFKEETGIETQLKDWSHFATMRGPQWGVVCFCGRFDVESASDKTAEKTAIVKVESVMRMRGKMVANLPWLISMAVDRLQNGELFRAAQINYV